MPNDVYERLYHYSNTKKCYRKESLNSIEAEREKNDKSKNLGNGQHLSDYSNACTILYAVYNECKLIEE